MASVTSLGFHQPTGLPYATQERLLPPDPPTSSYTWHNSSDGDADSASDDDELIVTSRAVIWSRGGIFQQSYQFDLENEPVTHALVTYFPSAGSANKGEKIQGGGNHTTKPRAKALVVFLKTQAHVYFLAGSSHIIHLPFEVESVLAAPEGLILQRKLRGENQAAISLKFPRVPPNSFVSSQPQIWSAASSQQSTFSIADLNEPKQLPKLLNPTLQDLWEPPLSNHDEKWPRLFSLSDPLSEMGLVVTQQSKPNNRGRRRSSLRISSLDPAEEILYVSRRSELANTQEDSPLILAVTLNRETSMYTVWRLSYIKQESKSQETKRHASGTSLRRRSSFVRGTTGTTTPVPTNQNHLRDSFAGNTVILPKNNLKKVDSSASKDAEFVSTLDPDYEGTALPRRKSRRVSSMLARADLSATHERSAFSDLATGHQHSRRGDSLGSQNPRISTGALVNPQSSQFSQSLNSFLEAPVDDLLDELRAGGDFEGFHNMGLDDVEFDALRQEIVLTKINSVSADHSNVRYSSQHMPAQSRCKIFTLTAPPSAADDRQKNTIVLCILDADEKRLLVLTLTTRPIKKAQLGPIDPRINGINAYRDIHVALMGDPMRAKGVIDACRIDDGLVSRILVLIETPDGLGELTLQAPWSVLIRVSLPVKFTTTNIHSLGHDPNPRAKREGGFRRVLAHGPRALRGLRNSRPGGLVDLVDEEGKLHQLRIVMEPRNPQAIKVLEVCRAILPGFKNGEGVLVGWWNVMQWLRLESVATVDQEWTAVVIILFSMVLGFSNFSKLIQNRSHARQKKSRSSILRSSSGVQADTGSWEAMQKLEASNGDPYPSWAHSTAWKWLTESDELGSGSNKSFLQTESDDKEGFILKHVRLARQFVTSSFGQSAVSTYLPTSPSGSRSFEARTDALKDIILGLHLLREEQKLDTMTVDSLTSGVASLTPVLAQMIRWLGWASWVDIYDVEEASLVDASYDTNSPFDQPLTPPFELPIIYDWIRTCLISQTLIPFATLPDIISNQSNISLVYARDTDQWYRLTPRTLSFERFFDSMRHDWTSAKLVEALASAGIKGPVLETLPEAVLAPLMESIVHCQSEPPTTWSKDLLGLVGREDVNLLLTPGKRTQRSNYTILAPSHESNVDVHTICELLSDIDSNVDSFDGSAEAGRQAITRSIFRDDRRMDEAINIMNTFKPTVARCKSQPEWTESELLEAQKDHVQMLAYRTLAIPAGRGLLFFSGRKPLLTQRLNIGGFNLNCIMKPDNNTVGLDKMAFTEEKVCWPFFHAGVAAGLSISRDASGIDTSWILYNKPAQDLSNRHAGFLLALGLNGHLKALVKWVAFKYLTPKHTMTSVGLLLGLAASYIGTMDSLVTRLLSVHVTRMLPPGAAELNLSPLTQTTCILGIGLLYCNTQHRRMSEIMVSEIEHIDQEMDEEPLRNEGYRLAAGFALGLINLGKGSDLKGLHDMRLTERLLTLAAGSKKVDLVHILDKATAAAVVAIALIFMKSEDHILARKIDVPDSILQFDYVRPDIFLLRTLAKHLIMWSKIEPTYTWIEEGLPLPYRRRGKLENITNLTSDDLPFYDILTGLCFSIALRYAGSASLVARDLLLHYLDQIMRICQITADTYDKKLTRNTVRTCQDLLALGAAMVMAGTGDLPVFRRLRSLHGRDDSDTPYGSHLAAHLAIGSLFLAGGTYTFGTSNIAIAALLIAFYPIFPSNIQDNKSHLQAFRHFWVLATEARCLVARDIDTNQPVALPLTIALRKGEAAQRTTPCLLPELDQIQTVRTNSREYWNIVLDLQHNPTHIASFKATQTIFVRKRPAYDATTPAFQATIQALNDIDGVSIASLEWLFELPAFSSLTKAERALVLPPDNGGASDIHAGTGQTVVDTRLVLENATLDIGKRDRLLGLKLLFEWADKAANEGREMQWIRREVVDRLKAKVWIVADVE